VIPSFSFIVVAPKRSITLQRMGADDEPDLFEYFDPLLSPHAYPEGIDPDHKPKDMKITEDDRETPTRLHNRSTKAEVDPTQVFDPTLSPHAYPDGTPSAIVGDEVSPVSKKKVGILLVDHGSKKKASNERLEQLARIYQESVDSSVMIVKAAHMEIAEPSIPDGLEALLSEGVDEIICHPYFLSPDGRHVSEDIPEIVNGAIKSLNIEVPIITTEPVGADMNLMVQVVQSICEESSQVLSKKQGK